MIDPIFRLIEEHRHAYDRFDTANAIFLENEDDEVADARVGVRLDVLRDAERTLLDANPTTWAGMVALARYLVEAGEKWGAGFEAMDFLRALARDVEHASSVTMGAAA